VKTADVFVENYQPGALDRLGLGYTALAELNPRLVDCSVSAYGHTGPDASRPRFGLIAEAKSGCMDLVGVPGQPPPLFRVPVANFLSLDGGRTAEESHHERTRRRPAEGAAREPLLHLPQHRSILQTTPGTAGPWAGMMRRTS
jgi:hypothetical protein